MPLPAKLYPAQILLSPRSVPYKVLHESVDTIGSSTALASTDWGPPAPYEVETESQRVIDLPSDVQPQPFITQTVPSAGPEVNVDRGTLAMLGSESIGKSFSTLISATSFAQ
jgi:hypothetical protein